MPVTVPQGALQDLVRRALDVAAAPMGWISFLDGKGERIEARIGVAFTELIAERSFALRCGAMAEPRFIEDAAVGEWRDHPLVTGDPRARFVGIVPLVSRAGAVMGTLTVLDSQPRAIRKSERTALSNLASLAAARVRHQRVEPRKGTRPAGNLRAGSQRLASRGSQDMRSTRSSGEIGSWASSRLARETKSTKW